MSFILNAKSDYSFLKSNITISDLILSAKKNHSNYCALIDYNLHGAYDFYNQCLANNLTPILGIEINVSYQNDIFPLIFLASSERGYHNLIKISSNSLKYNNVVELASLSLYSEDIIAIIPSFNSYVTYLYTNNHIFEINEYVDLITSIFKEVYFGVYRYLKADFNLINELKDYFNSKNIKAIAMQQALHKKKDNKDIIVLNLLNCIKNNIPASKEYLNDVAICEAYLKNNEELAIYYDKEELNNLDNLANNIHLKINKINFKLPSLFPSDKLEDELKNRCYQALKDKNINDENHLKRLEYELSVILKMGFSNYYFVVSDYVNYARNNDIPVGPARGSGGASLVAYLLNITTFDPLEYDLLFERFLNPERINYPDFDVDFADIKRDEIIQYVINKYGYKHVAHIATYATFGVKSAIRDLARVMKISNDDVDYILKNMSDNAISIASEYKNNQKFKDLLDIHGDYRQLCSLASEIEGLKKQSGLHAAGLIISEDELSDLVPTFETGENILAIQFEAPVAEKIGLIKMDFLGLKNLSIIDYCFKKLNQNYNIANYNYDENETYEIISSLKTIGIFQLESKGINKVISILKPTCFNHIVDLLALYRPGPMDMINEYVARKNGKEYQIIKGLEDILDKTYGILIYQEQIMQICQKVANFSLGEADILRRAISKKNISLMESLKDKFIKQAINNNYSEKEAKEIYALILKFVDYGFNKAHSVGYAIITCVMASLKAKYPSLFYEALLNVNKDSGKKKEEILLEAKKLNVKVLGPNVNESDYEFKANNDTLLFGLTNILSIKEIVANIIIKERNIAPFNDLFDFIIRMVINDVSFTALEDLTLAGALDSFNVKRNKIIANLENLYNSAFLYKTLDYQPNTYKDEKYSFIPVPLLIYENNEIDYLLKEHELLGVYLSPHPLTIFKNNYSEKITSLADIIKEGSYKIIAKITLIEEKKNKKNEPYERFKLEDETGNIIATSYSDHEKVYKKDYIIANLTYKNGFMNLYKIRKIEVENEKDNPA